MTSRRVFAHSHCAEHKIAYEMRTNTKLNWNKSLKNAFITDANDAKKVQNFGNRIRPDVSFKSHLKCCLLIFCIESARRFYAALCSMLGLHVKTWNYRAKCAKWMQTEAESVITFECNFNRFHDLIFIWGKTALRKPFQLQSQCPEPCPGLLQNVQTGTRSGYFSKLSGSLRRNDVQLHKQVSTVSELELDTVASSRE